MSLFDFLNNREPAAGEMTFIDHLEELRWHIIRSVIAVLVAAIFIFINSDFVADVAAAVVVAAALVIIDSAIVVVIDVVAVVVAVVVAEIGRASCRERVCQYV